MKSAPQRPGTLLAVDSGSPLVSVALGDGTDIFAHRAIAISHSSEALLRIIDEVLVAEGISIADVGGLLGLRGPGSFTGLRVGLATLLGLHQALAIPATALPTLEVMALAAPPEARRVITVVDALRGEWYSQLLIDGEPAGEARIRTPELIRELQPEVVIAHDVERLADLATTGVAMITAGELAPLALRFATRRQIEWAPGTLLDPLYLRPPAIHGRGLG